MTSHRLHLSLIARILPLALTALIAGCGPSPQDYDQAQRKVTELEKQVASLRVELEDVKFGAARLLVQAKAYLDAANDIEAKRTLEDLVKRHPAAPESKEAAALLAEVGARIEAAELQRKLEEEQKIAEARLALERATRNMKKNTDDIKGITWVSHRNAPVLGKYVSVYFGTNNGSAENYPLRLKVQYHSDNWLFVRSITVKADDKVYELGVMDFERDNSSGSVWEWIDVPVKDHDMLSRWMTAKRVVIRFNGDKYYDDFVLPERQQLQLREVYAAWTGMGGKP